MSKGRASSVFLCNGANPPNNVDKSECTALNYLPSSSITPNVRIGLPRFVLQVSHLPDRYLDLLEIAAYVFAADRLTPRGSREAVEYQSWSRKFHFIVKVRDYDFWSRSDVGEKLGAALRFTTGDHNYEFTFQAGHSTLPMNLFDDEVFSMQHNRELSITLFSGGIDSLAGAIQRLEQTSEHVCLVSHLSQVGTIQTQRQLAAALKRYYPKRVSPYQFKTNLQGIRSKEETQRSRPFLFGSIAFTLAMAFGSDRFYFYENGVTSLNFTRRDDLINARASRTTHPQTVGRLRSLFSTIAGKPFSIETPFLWNTKSDVVRYLKCYNHGDLLNSSVSCSRTYNSGLNATHCGECFQCLDRRIGIYGADAHELENESLYANDIITAGISSEECITTAVDYLRQAARYSNWNLNQFYRETLDDLHHLLEWVPGCDDEFKLVESVWKLYSKHGQQVAKALRRMRDIHENVLQNLESNSLLKIVSDREFLKEPIERLVASIEKLLTSALPGLFQSRPPSKEKDLNDKIDVLLQSQRIVLHREHPTVPFALAGVKPDFSIDRGHLLIEAKYIRKGTTMSKATEGMAADLTKYPREAHILFVVYDPKQAIKHREKLKQDFENKGRCTVCILP